MEKIREIRLEDLKPATFIRDQVARDRGERSATAWP